MTLTPCPGGDCHGIDHAWCAPGRHLGEYGHLAQMWDHMLRDRPHLGKHRSDRP